MIKFENTNVMNMDGAIRGMRLPLKSGHLSDSYWTHIEDQQTIETAKYEFFVGEKDLDLMKRLCKAGSDHRKFLRQIFVTVDITAPRFGGLNLILTRLERLQTPPQPCTRYTQRNSRVTISATTGLTRAVLPRLTVLLHTLSLKDRNSTPIRTTARAGTT